MTDDNTPDTNAVMNATAVNFYILPDSDLDARLLFVFRLIEKAFDKQLTTLVIGADEQQLADLDRLIWAAKPARFIPHEVIADTITSPMPTILLGKHIQQAEQAGFTPQIVIDLSYDATPLQAKKVMLVANQHQEILSNARMKYQSYVNHGIQPVVHKL